VSFASEQQLSPQHGPGQHPFGQTEGSIQHGPGQQPFGQDDFCTVVVLACAEFADIA
jgi:hypothetical protein